MRPFVVLAIALVCSATAARCASADDPFALSANGDRRLYASGIIGDSFTTIASGGMNTAGGSPVTNTGAFAGDLFTAGGALGAAAERPFTKLPALANCSVTQLAWPGPRLVAFNETSHIDG